MKKSPEIIIFDGYQAEELFSHYAYRYFPNSLRILDAPESKSLRDIRKNEVYKSLYQDYEGGINSGNQS